MLAFIAELKSPQGIKETGLMISQVFLASDYSSFVGGISGSEKQLFPTQSLEIGYIDLPSRSIKRALVRA